MTPTALTEDELDLLRKHSDVLAEGTFCPDPSPFHADLVHRAFLRLVYLEERADLLKSELTIRDDENTKLREQLAYILSVKTARDAYTKALNDCENASEVNAKSRLEALRWAAKDLDDAIERQRTAFEIGR